MKTLNILVIDDERVICDACCLVLAEKGHSVDHCLTGNTGLLAIERGKYDLILLDVKLPDVDGMEILKSVREKGSRPVVIVMTGYSTMSNAVLQFAALGLVIFHSRLIRTVNLHMQITFRRLQPVRHP